MKKPFTEPALTEEAALVDVTLSSGGGYDVGANKPG